MSAAVVLMGAGMALQMYGQYQANKAQADAEAKNAEFFRMEGKHAEAAARREESIYRQESEEAIGMQTTTFAKAGVDISGSPLMVLAQARSTQMDEISAIKNEGALRARLAYARGEQAQSEADVLRSAKYNLLQMGGTFLTGSGRILSSRSKD